MTGNGQQRSQSAGNSAVALPRRALRCAALSDARVCERSRRRYRNRHRRRRVAPSGAASCKA